jgi:ATP-dependent exoDNAse (exonuclease V) beta subunit
VDALAAARRALATVAASPLGAEIERADESHDERSFVLSFASGGEVEGRIDLMIRRGKRWRIVDWKTDDLEAGEVARAAEDRGYELQLGLYALAAARILGVESIDATLFFTTPGVALERRFDRAALEPIADELARDLERIAHGALV